MNRFVLLSGPSCVGKGPLFRSIKRIDPKFSKRIEKIVLYNDRKPRLGEVHGEDYRFCSSGWIKKRPDSDYIKVNLGSEESPNWQALDLNHVRAAMKGGRIAFLEAHYTIVEKLEESGLLRPEKRCSVFMSPLSRCEIEDLKKRKDVILSDFITDVMRRKLLRRTLRQKGILSFRDLEDIEKRAGRAPKEMAHAHRYDYIVPNHDGEDSDNWEQFYYPIGDARNAWFAFRAILRGETSDHAEKWGKDLFPST